MATPYEQLKERAAAWTAPISPEAPAGRSAQLEPAFEQLMAELGKLDGLSGAAVDWRVVVERGGDILQRTSKDLRVAAYLAYGAFETRGLQGLAEGLATVAELVDGFWPTMFPEVARLRGRVNALDWLLKRLGTTLAAVEVGAADRGPVEALVAAMARLDAVVGERFQASAPSTRAVNEAVERLKRALPAEAPPPAPAAEAPPAAAQAAPAPRTATPAAPAAPASLTRVEDAVEFLRATGSALLTTGAALRKMDSTSAAAYRLVRTGMWLHILQAPPAGPNGRTAVPPLPAALRAQLDKHAENGRWAQALEESEAALPQARFALDLHRHSARALHALGPSHQAAHAAVVAELGALLRRLPALVELQAADGTPLADELTRAWLEEEVLGGKGGAPAGAPAAAAPADPVAAVVGQAQGLARDGKLPDAVALLQGQLQGTRGGADRFRLRLALARACAAAGQRPLALGLFEALDREAEAHRLDAWEPALAAQALEGLLACARQLKVPQAGPEWAARYQRLCVLDPTAALRLGG